MIPVLIMPAYNRHDLLLRALRSIDVPVEAGLIFDNGRNLSEDPLAPDVFAEAADLNLKVFTPPYASIGYGGAINTGILQTAEAPWWLWVSNDVAFHPGHLDTVVRRMNEATEPTIITGGFTWGAVNRELVEAVGLVDEHSFFPIYYDDNDYQRRCTLAGVHWIEDWSDGTEHGDDRAKASLTIHSDVVARAGNHRSFQQNTNEYWAKWGGLPGDEKFTSPWDSGMPVWVTRPSVNARRNRQW